MNNTLLFFLLSFFSFSCMSNRSHVLTVKNYSHVVKLCSSADSLVYSFYNTDKCETISNTQNGFTWNIGFYESGEVMYIWVLDTIVTKTYVERSTNSNDTSYTDSSNTFYIGEFYYLNGQIKIQRNKINDTCYSAKYFSSKGKFRKEEFYCK